MIIDGFMFPKVFLPHFATANLPCKVRKSSAVPNPEVGCPWLLLVPVLYHLGWDDIALIPHPNSLQVIESVHPSIPDVDGGKNPKLPWVWKNPHRIHWWTNNPPCPIWSKLSEREKKHIITSQIILVDPLSTRQLYCIISCSALRLKNISHEMPF